MDNIYQQTQKRIRKQDPGAIFTPSDFLDLGARTAIDQALSRLTKKGEIRRLARGLYQNPVHHAVLGILEADPEAIASSLAKKRGARVLPGGALAANLLGLSEQVPARITFLTDGPSRRLRIGHTEINLRRTSARNTATAGRFSGLLIQALRNSRRPLAEAHINRLRKTIPYAERAKLLKDLRYAPAWMHETFRALAKKEA